MKATVYPGCGSYAQVDSHNNEPTIGGVGRSSEFLSNKFTWVAGLKPMINMEKLGANGNREG